MGLVAPVEQAVEAAVERHTTAHPGTRARVACSEPQTLWHKLDHLLYLPILGLKRPSELYYYQGPGLKSLYGFTYRYLTLEHFLGEMAQLEVGYPLAEVLGCCYQQAWYPGDQPLRIFIDWHTKPYWTKQIAHSNHIAMWGRVMPGTKQLVVTGTDGHPLLAINMAVDCHFNDVLVDLEEGLVQRWKRPIALSIIDSEGGGLPMALRYTEANRAYLTVVSGGWQYALEDFLVLGGWEGVEGDPEHEAADGCWLDPAKRKADPRRLVLMRRLDDPNPTRLYAGHIPVEMRPGMVPGQHRQRWRCQERRIREMVNGANLNVNYGYGGQQVPNRTLQRRWEEAQARVQASERSQAWDKDAIRCLQEKLVGLRQRRTREIGGLQAQIITREAEGERRAARGLALTACQRRIEGLHERQRRARERASAGGRRLLEQIRKRRERLLAVGKDLAERCATRDAIDTSSLCWERGLQKDQVMLDLQVLLTSLHDWVREHYLPPEWRTLELDTATKLIYSKAGRVTWSKEEICVELEAYRYPEQQRAMEETCARLNQARIHWRDGRLMHMRVAPAL